MREQERWSRSENQWVPLLPVGEWAYIGAPCGWVAPLR